MAERGYDLSSPSSSSLSGLGSPDIRRRGRAPRSVGLCRRAVQVAAGHAQRAVAPHDERRPLGECRVLRWRFASGSLRRRRPPSVTRLSSSEWLFRSFISGAGRSLTHTHHGRAHAHAGAHTKRPKGPPQGTIFLNWFFFSFPVYFSIRFDIIVCLLLARVSRTCPLPPIPYHTPNPNHPSHHPLLVQNHVLRRRSSECVVSSRIACMPSCNLTCT